MDHQEQMNYNELYICLPNSVFCSEKIVDFDPKAFLFSSLLHWQVY